MLQGQDVSTETTSWYVYLLRCSDGSLYTGITSDLERRLAEHNAGAPRGARYTRTRRPVRLVWHMCCDSRSSAQKEEHRIRKLPRQDKLLLERDAQARMLSGKRTATTSP